MSCRFEAGSRAPTPEPRGDVSPWTIGSPVEPTYPDLPSWSTTRRLRRGRLKSFIESDQTRNSVDWRQAQSVQGNHQAHRTGAARSLRRALRRHGRRVPAAPESCPRRGHQRLVARRDHLLPRAAAALRGVPGDDEVPAHHARRVRAAVQDRSRDADRPGAGGALSLPPAPGVRRQGRRPQFRRLGDDAGAPFDIASLPRCWKICGRLAGVVIERHHLPRDLHPSATTATRR